jgi:DNA-binding MarR family transcriptional regulator
MKALAKIEEVVRPMKALARKGIIDALRRLPGATGLTVNQFGLLAQLDCADISRSMELSMGRIADRPGLDPTTLNRNLKCLCLQGLVKEAIDAADRRVRIIHVIRVTEKGRRRSERAMPFSRQAQVARAMGEEAIATLSGLLDQSTRKLDGVPGRPATVP